MQKNLWLQPNHSGLLKVLEDLYQYKSKSDNLTKENEKAQLEKKLKEVTEKKNKSHVDISELRIKLSKAEFEYKEAAKEEKSLKRELDNHNNLISVDSDSDDLIQPKAIKSKRTDTNTSSSKTDYSDFQDFQGQKLKIQYVHKDLMIEAGNHMVKVNKPKIKGPLFDIFRTVTSGRIECSCCLKVCKDDNDLMAHIAGIHPREYNRNLKKMFS